MTPAGRAVVTGAFSYTGAAVARELIRRDFAVHTLTNRQAPAGESRISSAPLRFDATHLERELRGADVFINTYWIRLPFGGQTFDTAVENSRTLIEAAARAGVRRIVHVSVSNAAAGASLGYYAGKARVENIVRRSGIPFSIVRPTLVVGPSDVLTNNIAWFLRHFPVFPIPGGGRCWIQPVTLDDTARIIADTTTGSGDIEIDAAGPDTVSFIDYVRWVAKACGTWSLPVAAPSRLSLIGLRMMGLLLRDIILTREELVGLEAELLVSHAPPVGTASVKSWLDANGSSLGQAYANDLHRHFGAGRTLGIKGA